MPSLSKQSFHARFCLDALGMPVASTLIAQDGSAHCSLLIFNTTRLKRGLQADYSTCSMMLSAKGCTLKLD